MTVLTNTCQIAWQKQMSHCSSRQMQLDVTNDHLYRTATNLYDTK